MTPPRRQPSNLPASVHARLLRLAKQSDANFNVVLVRFATERLLYRLSRSPHAERFLLKGAWLFYVWDLERRVTRDLDLPVEAVVAEKLEAMVRFDALNTRLKDYFDLYVLATEMAIDDASLTRQLAETFRRRRTAIPEEVPVGLSDTFVGDSERQARWRAFLDRSGGAASAPASFPEVVDRIRELVLAPLEAAPSAES